MTTKNRQTAPKPDNKRRKAQALTPDLFDDMQFPATRECFVDWAKERGIAGDQLNRLRQMPERTYNSINEFHDAFAHDLNNYGATDRPSPEMEEELEK